MNYLDIVITVTLLWFGYKGFTKGLVIELVSIIALCIGVYGGLKFSYILSGKLVDDVDGKYLPLVSFTLTFVIIVLCIFIIGKGIEKLINVLALKLVNKLAGAGFGVLKMALIISIVITIIESYDKKLHFLPVELKENSLFYSPMLNLSSIILPEIEKNQLLQETKNDFSLDENQEAE